MTSPLAGMIPQRPSLPVVARRFATVTSVAPLRVRLDGDDIPADADPISLVAGLAIGHRVRIEIDNRQLIITGRIHTY
ncbi:hypothetical protein AB0K08_13520 [Citricoccus sp. NPDC055426]|uniref:hypothetical protein n=1 Tax=Citricoccus sp. NPDC055426 TaxID=3155536 RepID=UPI0034170088